MYDPIKRFCYYLSLVFIVTIDSLLGFFSGHCLIGNILVRALLLKYHTCKTKKSAKEQWPSKMQHWGISGFHTTC